MPRPHLPHLQLEWGRKRADGTRARVYYFRKDRTAPRYRIAHEWGSAEFVAEYNALMAGHFAPVATAMKRKASGKTLTGLFTAYKQSQAWKALAVTTRRARDRLLSTVLDDAGGDADLEDIDRAAILRLIDKHATAPHQANHIRKTLNMCFDWAVEEKIVAENPCARVHNLATHSKDDGEEEGHPTWTDEDLDRFEARYPIGTRERLVYAVLLYTGLRIGDASRLGMQHVKNGMIELKTEKTGTVVYIDIAPELQAAIAAGPKGRDGALAFLTHSRGEAFVKESLGNWFRRRVEGAGLKDRSAHGLRKAAARLLAEDGANEAKLSAVFGWNDPRMPAKYVREANKRLLAKGAMGGVSRGRNRNIFVAESGSIPVQASTQMEENVNALFPYIRKM
jgi:integrase